MFKQMKLDDGVIEANANVIVDRVAKIEDDEKRKGILKFFADLGDRYFTSPGSTRANYHSTYPGGLADHSLRVYRFAQDLYKNYYSDEKTTPEVDDSIFIAAIFHDAGKMGDLEHENYIPQDSQWHKEKLGEFYKVNPDIDFLEIQHRSIFLLMSYGVKLSLEEFKGIMLHDGQYSDANKRYAMKEGIFSVLIHQADMLATMWEKEQYLEWNTKQ